MQSLYEDIPEVFNHDTVVDPSIIVYKPTSEVWIPH